MQSQCVELDGSLGEGGGQILRSSLALSLLTGKTFHLRNVRARRKKPGLQPQHLMSVRAAATIGRATVVGATLHSTDLAFEPGPVTAGKYHFPIGTAGATGLVLHTVYLPLALRTTSSSELLFEGGTHVTASPCYDFLNTTWRAYMAAMGMQVSLKMRRSGFYPRGGGAVEAIVQPCRRVTPLQLRERSEITRISGFSAVAGLPEEIAERQARRAFTRLKKTRLETKIDQQTWSGGPGTVLALILDTTPAPTLFFGLGARGKRAETVADEAVESLTQYLDFAPAAVDAHSADQIILPLAFADGSSSFTVAGMTEHLRTNIEVIRRFVDREIICEGEIGSFGKVTIA